MVAQCRDSVTNKVLMSSSFESTWRNDQNHSQACDDDTGCDEANEKNGATRGREFATNNVVLRLEVAMEAENEDEYGCDEVVSNM